MYNAKIFVEELEELLEYGEQPEHIEGCQALELIKELEARLLTLDPTFKLSNVSLKTS